MLSISASIQIILIKCASYSLSYQYCTTLLFFSLLYYNNWSCITVVLLASLIHFLLTWLFTLPTIFIYFFSCKDDIPSALEKYSSMRASDTKAIVKMSERLDGGFFTFVLPLIVDSILHKLMPKIFSPNTIKSIQDPELTYTQIKLRWSHFAYSFSFNLEFWFSLRNFHFPIFFFSIVLV